MKKSFILILMLILVIYASIITLLIIKKDSLAANEVVYTRSDLQNYIVSNALEYYYKRSYTDYEQYAMDDFKSYYRLNINNNPLEINAGNTINLDCSGFAMMLYLQTFGFNFTENDLYKVYKHHIYPSVSNGKMDFVNSTVSKDVYESLYENHGKAYWIEQIIQHLNYAAKNNSNYYNDLVVYAVGDYNISSITTSSIKKYLDITNLYDPNVSNAEFERTRDIVISDLKEILQPGDIFIYSRNKASTDDNGNYKVIPGGGHAMVYVGNAISNDSSNGFIHSTGNDMVISNDGTLKSYGYDSNGIKYDDFDTYIKNIYYNKEKFPKFFMILRPINYYLNSSEKITNSNLKNKVLYEKYLSNFDTNMENNITKNKLKYLSIEQYITQVNNLKWYPYGSSVKPLGDYSTIGNNDKIQINIKLTNNSKISYCTKNSYTSKSTCESNGYVWKTSRDEIIKYNNLTIKVPIPSNTDYVNDSCYSKTGSCSYDSKNKIVIFNNVSNSSTGGQLYYFKVQANGTGKDIVVNGATVTYTNNYNYNLKMGNQIIKVNDYNNLNNDVKELLIINDNFKCSNSSDVSCMKEFLKDFYSNVKSIDFTKVNSYLNYESHFQSVKVQKNSYSSADKNVYLDGYYKKPYLENNIVVKGMYGGRKLVGNILSDRMQIIKSYYLEYGDILYTRYNDKDTIYLYVGHNKQYEPKFITIENNKIKKIGFSDTKDSNNGYLAGYHILKNIFAKDLYAILRPSQIYKVTNTSNSTTTNHNNSISNGSSSNTNNTINNEGNILPEDMFPSEGGILPDGGGISSDGSNVVLDNQSDQIHTKKSYIIYIVVIACIVIGLINVFLIVMKKRKRINLNH